MISEERILEWYEKRIVPYAVLFFRVLRFSIYLFSFLFLLSGIYRYGFQLTEVEGVFLHRINNLTWGIFMLYMVIGYIFRTKETAQRVTPWMHLLYALLFLTLLPVIFQRPVPETGVMWVWDFFHHPFYRMAVLSMLSVTFLSDRFVKLLGKRTNPSLILAGSFFFIILVGAGLLMLPRSTYSGIHWLDAFFLSTSATCVAGLSTVDMPAVLTLEGQTILIILVQIGGLGVMTITSFFALLFMKNSSLYSNMVVSDMLSTNSLNSLLSTLFYIMGFTFFIEGIGAVFIWLSVRGSLGVSMEEELYFAFFHSVSAFCNAGFSSLPDGLGSTLIFRGHNALFLVLSFLVILGGVGFPVLVNFRSSLLYYSRRLWWRLFHRSQPFRVKRHLHNLNTQIVLVMTAVLLISSTLAIALLEWNGALQGMHWTEKCTHAFFSATCTRSAGFSSMSITAYAMPTMLLMFLLMTIGGGAQSTAGGMRVNVFAVVLLNLRTALRGGKRTIIAGRELSEETIRHANAAFFFFFSLIFVGVFLLSLTESDIPFSHLLAESIAAVSTAGVSIDFTPRLSECGKVVVLLLMFLGRVGAFTLVAGLMKRERQNKFKYPEENVIMN